MSTTKVVTSNEAPAAKTETYTHKEPLKLSGALSQFKHFDVTPVIGREYPEINLKEFLNAPNSDELLRDLAITSTTALHVSE
jgi:hypothetical protein